VYGSALTGALTRRPSIYETREAAVSAEHTVAIALIRGVVDLHAYQPACITDPAVVALRHRVTVIDDSRLPEGQARLVARTKDGRVQEVTVGQWLGSLDRPLSDSAVAQKFTDLCAYGAAHCNPERLIDLIRRIETLPSISPILQDTGPTTGI
jgi:2-methylcitrate dehydratase PrpD